MTFDAELRDLADRAAHAHVAGDGFASTAVKGRVRRARRVYRTTVAAGSVAAVAVLGVLGTAVAQRWPEPAPPAQTVEPSPEPPEPEETPTPPALSVDGVLAGWGDLGVDPAVFGDAWVTDSVTVDGVAVAVGCQIVETAGTASSSFPAWVSDDGVTWVGATGPATSPESQFGRCLTDIVPTPHGLFAHDAAAFGGEPSVFRSDDGSSWTSLAVGGDHEIVDAIVVVGDRVTVLTSRAAEAESRVAALYTSTDGEVWTEVTDGSARVFDNAGVAQVIGTGDGLAAVGASPGGEFVPTAAAWTSADGLHWVLTTPTGEGFDGAYMTAVTSTGNGYVAVGTCPFESGLMCAWSSPDGVAWTPDASPDEQVNAGVAYLQPLAVTLVDDVLYAMGRDWDASRPDAEQVLPAAWRRIPGGAWERVDPAAVGDVPFARTDVGGRVVGFWPGYGWPGGELVRVLTRVG